MRRKEPRRTPPAEPDGRSIAPRLARPTRAIAEWHRLDEVLVHRPGIESFFGLLEPQSFLYERAFRIDEASYEHGALEHALTEAGVRVRHLIHLAIEIGRDHPFLMEEVRRRVVRLVRYSGPKSLVTAARSALRKNLDSFDGETLFNILLLRPSIALERGRVARAVRPRIRLDTPLANLCYLRDQQALTPNGYVLGRMSKPQRRHEPVLTGVLLRAGGATIAGAIGGPGTFEGGDFLPMGDFAFLGTGDRTNAAAVRQFLALPTGLTEVAVVRQPRHPALPTDDSDPMINMHLDTYFNVPGDGLAVGCGPLLDRARTVVYRRRGRRGFEADGSAVSLRAFLASKKIDLIEISTLEQMCYATNFLCVRDRQILAVDVEREVDRVLANLGRAARIRPHRYAALFDLVRRERELRRGSGDLFPRSRALRDRGVEVVPLDLREITGGYGGAHCLTCVVRRTGP